MNRLKEAYVKDVMAQLQKEEISYSRMVELLNEGKGITENVKKFTAELEQLINKYSLENGSNTNDFVLAEYLTQCLLNYNNAVMHREYLKKQKV
jgi:hypothetical protein